MERLSLQFQREVGADRSYKTLLNPMVAQITRSFRMTLADYFGSQPLKDQVRGEVDWYFSVKDRPDLQRGFGIYQTARNGFLLVGPPGVGKTFFVTCFGYERGWKVFQVNIEQFVPKEDVEKKKGYTSSDDRLAEILEKLSSRSREVNSIIAGIKHTIDEAKAASLAGPVILFLDEFEEVGIDRQIVKENEELSRLVKFMLKEIEDIRHNHPNIVLFAAANFLSILDEAMLRPGRFDCPLELTLPGKDDITAIINGTFDAYGETLKMDESQTGELVTAAQNLIPISIQRAILIPFIKHGMEIGSKPVCFTDLLASMKIEKGYRTIIEKEMARRNRQADISHLLERETALRKEVCLNSTRETQ